MSEAWKGKPDPEDLEIQFPKDMPKHFVQVTTAGSVIDLSEEQWQDMLDNTKETAEIDFPFGQGVQEYTDIYGNHGMVNMGMIELARGWSQRGAQLFHKWNRWRLTVKVEDESDETD